MNYSLSSSKSNLSLQVLKMGYSDEISITRWGPGKRSYSIIHYVLSGKGYYNNNPVTKGQGFLIYPNQLHEYHAEQKNPWTFFWIVADGSDWEKILPDFFANEDTLIFDYDYIYAINHICPEIKAKDKMVVSAFESIRILMKILQNNDNNKCAYEKSKVLDYAILARDYIELNYSTKLTVSEITSKLGISQPYLYKIFRKTFNESPKEYINNYRLTQAKFLLKATNLNISEIGSAVGYDDVLAFSVFFSKYEKKSPSAFRII